MQTTAINSKPVVQTPQAAASTEGNNELFNEFSSTMDQIASKLLKNNASSKAHRHGQEAPAQDAVSAHPVHINVKSDAKPVEDKKPMPAQPLVKDPQPTPTPKKARALKEENSEQQTETTVEAEKDEPAAPAVKDDSTVEEKPEEEVPTQQEQKPSTDELAARAQAETIKSAEKEPELEEASKDPAPVQGEEDEQAADDNAEAAAQPSIEEEAAEQKAVDAPKVTDEELKAASADKPSEASSQPAAKPAEAAPASAAPAATTEAAQQANPAETEPQAQADISLRSIQSADMAQERIRQLDAKQAQDLLAQTLEKIIQNKLIDAASSSFTQTQRTTAFDIANEAQQAKTVISQLTQAISEAGGKGGVGNGTQAQGLQLNNNGASQQADSAQRNDVSKGKELSKPQAARTMEKVENALKEVSKSKDGKTISVRLDPPELGTVKVDVSYKEGSIHARIAAEQGSVAHLLKERTHELVTMIRKLGLNVDKVTVAVSSTGEEQTSTASFESFTKDSSNASKQGQQGNSRFGSEQGSTERAPQQQLTDHWIA